jgi:N-acetylmuramic acid 6-phosphate etherase
MEKTTESPSLYENLEQMSISSLLQNINTEDKKVAFAVEKQLPVIEKFVEHLVKNMELGGRLFYVGAGTSGRLGVVDASECPPTFGVPHDWVIGLIAGGDSAIRKAVEFAEDDTEQCWRDLLAYSPTPLDTVIGIAASGSTPYVIGGVKAAKNNGLLTACITCNAGSSLSKEVHHAIEVVVGPEFVTGSTRMKSGTAQKMVLNMISTTAMIKLGRVKGNKMVDMQLSNHKLVERGAKMLMEMLDTDFEQAKSLLLQHGSVRKVLSVHKS